MLIQFSAATTVVGDGRSKVTSDGALQITFPLNEKTSFNSFQLNNPARLVIDIPNAILNKKVQSLPIKGKFVQGVRLGTQQGTDLRIVVDMSQTVAVSTALLKSKTGYELVILVSESSNQKLSPSSFAESGTSVVSEQNNIQIAKQVPKKNVLIMIDPGHGGKDPGAVGPAKTREKDVVLALAKKLKAKIDKEPGMRAQLTRSGDKFIPLRERVLIAKRNKADMFISIHADAGSKTADGASVYILSTQGASSEAARLLAVEENKESFVDGVDMSDKDREIISMLLDISQDATIEASHELAQMMLKHLQNDTKLHKKQVERAGFAVLKAPDIPSVLVESGFLSNPKEERKLKTDAHQNRLANDLLISIKEYFKKRPATEIVYTNVKSNIQTQAVVNNSKSNSEKPKAQSIVFPKIRLESSVNNNTPLNIPKISLVSETNKNPNQKDFHIVGRGETLEYIAEKYKIPSIKLKKANNLPISQLRVVAGTRLSIPN